MPIFLAEEMQGTELVVVSILLVLAVFTGIFWKQIIKFVVNGTTKVPGQIGGHSVGSKVAVCKQFRPVPIPRRPHLCPFCKQMMLPEMCNQTGATLAAGGLAYSATRKNSHPIIDIGLSGILASSLLTVDLKCPFCGYKEDKPRMRAEVAPDYEVSDLN